MAVRIRLARFGRIHRPYFRIMACDKRVHREGVANEVIGTYDPLIAKQNIQIDMDKLKAWIAKGALISTALSSLLAHAGYEVPVTSAGVRKAAAKARDAKPKKDGKKFVKASRRSLRKHALTVKAATKASLAKAAAEKPAAAAAETPAS